MGKLTKYADKSTLMNIHIILGEEAFKFNLTEELLISEARINYEIMNQPSSFGFLSMLQVKLEKVVEDLKLETRRVWSSKFIEYKEETNIDTGRPYNDDMAKAYADKEEEYIRAGQKLNEAKERLGAIKTCVESFQMRGFLIQTISANLRTEPK